MAKESTKKRTVTIKPGSRRMGLPYPRGYSLRVFYGPGHNPDIDQALIKIVGSDYHSSGCFMMGGQERDLEWDFRTKRSAVSAANRIINQVTVPGGKLLLPRERSRPTVTLGLVLQKIRRVEVWEEAPRRILSVGFQARREHEA
jgi:hypothetical protein